MSEMEMFWHKGIAGWLEDRASFGLFTTDPRLVVTGWNGWLESHSGRTCQEVIGKRLLDLYPDLVTRQMDQYFDEALEGRHVVLSQAFHGYLLPFKRGEKEGPDTIMAQSAVISPLILDEGISGIIGYIQDVNERVKREKELMDRLTEAKQAKQILKKRTRDLDERIKELNCIHNISALLVKQSTSLEDILERLVDLIPSGWQYPEIACVRILLTGKAYMTQNFAETEWRQAREIVVHGKPLGTVEVYYLESRSEADEDPFSHQEGDLLDMIAGRLGLVIERQQGETALRESESQLRQSQKMEAVSTLAGGIAHDFNNILTAIMGYGQLAQMKLDPKSEVYRDLKEVLESGKRAKLLIQQILAVGRSQEQERQPMQLKHIVREALKFLKSTLPSTIEIRETYDEDVGVIDADPTQMHQMLMNLCTNAGHAMEEDGGILKVSLRNVGVVPGKLESGVHLEPGAYLRLSVSDDGYGIAPEIREQIFDPYFTTKEPGVGTGIGLSVVHGIVTQHGGDITVESEPGKGTTFHVYFPLTQAEEDQPAVKEETPLPRGTERILLIDDEAVLARMGKEMLESLGYDVTAMTGSIEALALFKEDPKQFDLVITDTTMPHMPGDILAQKMMEIRPDMPAIICTGHSKRISKEKAKEMGFKGFLMKPLAMRDLAEMVRKALEEQGKDRRSSKDD